ncbi:flagellar motor switch protein FliM [Afifella sp. IM 167]|uniref:flagellar motor switch protein FliM n=1 Tax=Afifella sp. IM 167 TaxID=2033586 RepID=UPI001CCCD19E|nr:FliM/FliN family flagellar motor switch protein [Afifella sp. IM 167]MBZ8131792.1 flagellar motor switch protein FliM [Afifella sp. IM 167]
MNEASTDIRDMLLDAAGLSLDKLPMLQIIFDRMATFCADNLRHLAASQAYYSLSNVESGRIGDILERYEMTAIAGIFHAPAWDNHIIVGFDRDFIFSMVEILFGADGSEPPFDDDRSFSTIEMRICEMLFELAGKALQQSFALVSDTPFKFERQESRMDFAVIGRRNNMAVVANFLLQALGRGGEMFVIIPQSALTPMRQALSRVLTGESNAGDPVWSKQIRNEVEKTTVPLRAVMEEWMIDLGDVANFKVGQVLDLHAGPRSRIKLESNEQPLFWCELGQADGTYTLRVDEVFDPEQEFLNDILAR